MEIRTISKKTARQILMTIMLYSIKLATMDSTCSQTQILVSHLILIKQKKKNRFPGLKHTLHFTSLYLLII